MSDDTDVERYFTRLLLHVSEVSSPFRENRVVSLPPPFRHLVWVPDDTHMFIFMCWLPEEAVRGLIYLLFGLII